MSRFHPTILKQIRQFFGNTASIPENCRGFVEAINSVLLKTEGKQGTPTPEASSPAASETKYRMLFESANDPIIIIRPSDEKILEVNRKACEVYGYTREEFESMTLRSITKDKERGDSLIYDLLARGKNENIETVHFGKNGNEIQLHTNAYVVEYEDEKAIVSINRNLTPRMRAEARLRENEERLRLISENVTDYLALLDANGIYKYVTESYRHLGYDPSAILGTSILSYVHEEHQEIFARHLKEAVEKYAGSSFDLRFKRTDGTWMNAEIVISVMVGDEGVELAAAMRDVTERKRVERKNAEQAHLLDVALDSIIVCDADDKLLYWNDATEKLYGWTSEEMQNINVTRVVNEEDRGKYEQAKSEYLSAGQWEGDLRQMTKDGRQIITYSKWTRVESYDGALSARLIITRDVSTQRRAAEAFYNERLLLRTVIDNLPDAIFAKDTACRKTLANLADVHNMGCSSESEILGKDDYDFFPKDLADGFRADDMTVLTTGRPLANREEYVPDENGKKRWLLTTKLPLRDQNGVIIGLLGIGRDITKLKGVEEALSERESLLQTLIDLIPDYIYVKDTESRFLLGNRTLIRSFGKETMDEIVGKTDLDFHAPELARQFLADEQEIFRSGQPILNKDEHTVLPTGEWIWVVSTKIPLRDKQGKIIGLVGAGRDITKRKLAEEELRKSEATLRLIMDNAFDGISLYEESPIDNKRRLIECNRRYAELAGRTREELLQIGDTMPIQKSIKTEENVPALRGKSAGEAHPGTLPDGKNYRGLFSWIRPDVKENIIEFNAVPTMIDGRILRIGLDRDITDRVNMEENLRNGQMLLRTVLDNVPEAIYAKDLMCRKTLSNPADVRNISRATEADVLGKDDFDLFPKELAEGFYADDKAVITTGRGVINREEFVLDGKGQKRWLLTTKLPLRDQKGDIIGLVGIGLDITERKIAEEKLKKSEDNFVRMASNIEDILYSVDAESMEYRYLSPAFERILGYTEDDIRDLGGRRSFLSRVVIEEKYMHHGGVRGDVPAHPRGGAGDYYEAWWRCKDGAVKCLEDHWIPVFKNGVLVSTDGVMRDITERKKSDDELRKSEENFQRMAGHIDEVLYSVDEMTQEFRYLSPVFTKLFGYSMHDIQQMGGRHAFLAYITVEHTYIEPKNVIEDLPTLNSFEVSDHHATWWRCKDGTQKYIEDRWIALYERNMLVRTDGILRDITEQQRIEQEQRASEGKLKDRNAELEHMLDELQELQGVALRAEQAANIRRLAKGILGEIDTPLNTLSALVSEAAKSGTKAVPADLLKNIASELTRMDKVLEHLRSVCREDEAGGEQTDLLKTLQLAFPAEADTAKPKITILKK